MSISVYKKTATYGVNGKSIYAFGRSDDLHGKSTDLGGYAVVSLEKNYAGHVRGGIAKTWRVVELGLTYAKAVALLNKRAGFQAFTLK